MKNSAQDGTDSQNIQFQNESAAAAGGLRRYESPKLILLGDIRGITLGPSPGVFESGDGGGFDPLP